MGGATPGWSREFCPRSLISALLVCLLAASAGSADAPDGKEAWSAPALDAAATRRAWRDAAPAAADPPPPRLFYEDGDDGARLLIWAPEDTAPRDALAGRRPEVWLYLEVRADAGHAALLPAHLEHHARLGVAPERVLAVVHHDPAARSGGGGAAAAAAARALLAAAGADARSWAGAWSAPAALGAQLRALRRVPLRDWVLVAAADELLDFGGLPAREFLERRELEGATWVRARVVERATAAGGAPPRPGAPPWERFPLACAPTGAEAAGAAADAAADRAGGAPDYRLAAFRAFLRPRAGGRAALAAADAAAHLAPPPPGAAGALCAAAGDLAPFAPYARLAPFYRSKSAVGNAYQWAARAALPAARLHAFKRHAGEARAAAVRLAAHVGPASTPCGGVAEVEEAAEHWAASYDRVRDEALAAGGGAPGERCAPAPPLARLPLSERDARALAAMRALAATLPDLN
jgi:hypothetical protein